MEVVPQPDAEAFAAHVRPLLEPDPVRHTMLLTVLDAVCRGTYVPVAMLTVHEGDAVVGALLRTADRPALVSGVPPRCAEAVVDALLRLGLDAGGAQSPVEEAEAFAAAWSARTGARSETVISLRLFALGTLVSPTGVPGSARAVAPDDDKAIDLLTTWREAFEAEHDGVWPHAHTPRSDVERSLAGECGELIWEVDGTPVAQATARAVTAGMSRIGPVYTPPEHRSHGYAAAVTTAAAQWALDRGARHVLLHTDLTNPLTNRLYPRLGFRPRYDAVELRFVPPGAPGFAGKPLSCNDVA